MSLFFFVFLQPCLEVEFFYFGLRFCHLKTKVERLWDQIPFSIFRKDISAEMGKVIQQDIRNLNASAVGGYMANGSFVKLAGNKHIFVYHHSEHATCSGTKLSHLSGCVCVDRQEEDLVSCMRLAHTKHFSLWPFFDSNRGVLSAYKAIAPTNADIQAEVDQLEKIVKGEASAEGTPYLAPHPYTFNWQENDWTRRLVPGIQKLFPDRTVTYTATMGLTWSTDLLQGCLQVGGIARTGQLLFRGCPDVVIGKKRSVSAAQVEESASSSEEEELVENTLQSHPMRGQHEDAFPEKVGEVFAGLYIVLVSKVLRNQKIPSQQTCALILHKVPFDVRTRNMMAMYG